MSKKDTAFWYSGATDVTGSGLAEALGVSGDRKKPTSKKLVIGWGAKTKDNVTFPAGTVVLNHPNKIRDNRNKFTTLQALAKAKVAVADFVDAKSIIAELAKKTTKMRFPLVGRTNYHQGGKGFWLCLSKGAVDQAIKEGAQYFQNFIPIADEYRVHVFGTEVIYAQKKVIRKNMDEAFSSQHGEKIKNQAAKDGKSIDEETLTYALSKVGKRVQPTADMVVRSNMRGWQFSSIKLTNLKTSLSTVAKDAVKAIGLDFGAVDCCIDEDGNAFVIEINSGPGLEKTAFDKYVAKFEDVIKTTFAKKETVKTATTTAKKTETAKAAAQSVSSGGSVKDRLRTKAQLFTEMIEASDEAEAQVLDSIWKKMVASGN